MHSEQLLEEVEQQEGGQGWLATFADLMSLLMCFFVLLLSFSELDVVKFKQIAGSMKYAFGVQNRINVQDIPKGTSVIAQEFRPGKPEVTPIERIQQVTFEPERSSTEETAPSQEQSKRNENQLNDRKHRSMVALEENIITNLTEELNSGQFELDHQGQQLVIRIKENGSFASGSGFLQPKLKSVLRKLSTILAEIPGKVTVSGHTDDRPLNNELFQDNLELSAARAIAVARVLKETKVLEGIIVQGMGDTKPLLQNNSAQNRSVNRRVEITITQGEAKQADLPDLTSHLNKDLAKGSNHG